MAQNYKLDCLCCFNWWWKLKNNKSRDDREKEKKCQDETRILTQEKKMETKKKFLEVKIMKYYVTKGGNKTL